MIAPIIIFVVAASLPPVAVVLCIAGDAWHRPSRHQACLASIERLEREMGIGDWDDASDTMLLYPGARWPVDDGNADRPHS